MTKVYADFDQAELDHQYNVRAGIPDCADIFARWEHDSIAYRKRAGRAAHIDLAYGAEPLQTLDLFQAQRRDAPLVVFIHGGYWQSFDKKMLSFMAEPYVRDDLNFALVNYRLTPSVTMDDVVADCRAALSWLWHRADRLAVDRERIVVTGSSAGGHLTGVMASTDWSAFGLPPLWIKGACALSGLYDLEPIRLCYLNDKIGLDPASAARNSPIHMVPAAGPPLVLSTGGDETPEFHRQEAEMARRWRDNGLACERIPQDGGHHFDMVDRIATRGSSLYEAVHALMT